jgi:hypothetical protein
VLREWDAQPAAAHPPAKVTITSGNLTFSSPDQSVLGDPISVLGGPVRGTWGNGWTIYFLSWHQLLRGSATGDAVLASSTGSQFVPAVSVTSGPYRHSQRVAGR